MNTCTDLVVYDAGEDFESSVLEVQVKNTLQEAQEIEYQFERIQHEAGVVTSKFEQDKECKAALDNVFRLHRRIAELLGRPTEHIPDPDKPSEKPREAPEADGPTASDLPEVPTKAARSNDPRNAALKAKCRKIFLKLTRLTHPDKTKDKNLIEMFTVIKSAFSDLNLRALRQIEDDIDNYLALTKSKKRRKSVLRQTLEQAAKRKARAKQKLEQAKDQASYRIMELFNEGKAEEAKIVYMNFLTEQAHILYMQIASLNTGATLRYSNTYTYMNVTS